jgi:ribose 5-phosphate isomerase A
MEEGKKAAAYRAVDQYVTRRGMAIGVGSGSTIVYVVERLAQLKEQLSPLHCVPTSFQSRQLLVEAGLAISDLERHPELDVAIDGADEVDANCDCIKGGGGCQTQEKIVASCAKLFVLVADSRKQQRVLGSTWKAGVPIEIVPCAYGPVRARLVALGGKPMLRMAVRKAGPVVTDNGGWIVDCDFGELSDPAAIDVKIRAIVGVVESGLFVGMAQVALFGKEDGSVVELKRPK